VRVLRFNRVCPLESDVRSVDEATFTYRQDGWLRIRQGVWLGEGATQRPRSARGRRANRAGPSRPRAITVAQVMRVPALRMIASEFAVPTTPDEGAGGGEGGCKNEGATLS